MSGTSGDGVDFAAIDENNMLVAHEHFPYPLNLHKELSLNILEKDDATILEAEELMTEITVKALAEFIHCHELEDIAALGLHGHTLLHAPYENVSSTLVKPAIIAEQSKLKVVGNVRTADIEANGQGAPLAPFFHKEIFSSDKNRAVLNLGGIGNISFLEGDKLVGGFDTGPGNALIDLVCQRYLNKAYDKHGEIARSGSVDFELLASCSNDMYFNAIPPKSTGKEYFDSVWLDIHLRGRELLINDLVATLTLITAYSINKAFEYTDLDVDEMVVCGGGVNNHYLMMQIRELTKLPIISSQDLGWPSSAIEPAAWAWFAKKRLNNEFIDTSVITGAKHPVLLGEIF